MLENDLKPYGDIFISTSLIFSITCKQYLVVRARATGCGFLGFSAHLFSDTNVSSGIASGIWNWTVLRGPSDEGKTDVHIRIQVLIANLHRMASDFLERDRSDTIT